MSNTGSSSRTLTCKLVTPEGPMYEGAATFVVVPGMDGEIGFLPGHAAFVAGLGHGEMRLVLPGEKRILAFVVLGGFVQVQDNGVVVLATEAHRAQDLTPEQVAHETRRMHEKPGLIDDDYREKLIAKDRIKAIKRTLEQHEKRTAG